MGGSCNTYILWETSWEIRMLTELQSHAGAPHILRWTLGKKGGIRLDRYPALPLNLYRKAENNFSPCLERHLPSSPLAIHELVFPGSSSLETREVGANWAWWAPLFIHRQSVCTSKADSPDQQQSLSTGKHWNGISFFQIRFSKEKHKQSCQRNLSQMDQL